MHARALRTNSVGLGWPISDSVSGMPQASLLETWDGIEDAKKS
jgi:hypothetical protein